MGSCVVHCFQRDSFPQPANRASRSPLPQPSPAADAPAERVKVYAVGPDVTAPQLLPYDFTPDFANKCKRKMDGKVTLSVFVDSAGLPRNLAVLRSLDTDRDELAFQIAAKDRFIPGTHGGVPVIVGLTIEVKMQACIEERIDNKGKKTGQLRLRSQPVQEFRPIPKPLDEVYLAPGVSGGFRVGRDVSAPILIHHVDAMFTEEARRANYEGACLLSLVIDTQGMPHNIRVERPLDYGLSESAVEAVRQFQFQPAMKNGIPVPIKFNVEIIFHH